MPLLFAHHEMLDSLDFLGLHPLTPAEHVVAAAAYGLMALGAFWVSRAALAGVRRGLAARRSGGSAAEVVGFAGPRP